MEASAHGLSRWGWSSWRSLSDCSPLHTQDLLHGFFVDLETDKLAEMALGLLALTLYDGCRAGKGLDWDVMDLLHQRGWVLDSHGKVKSVVLTETGLELAETLLFKHVGRHPEGREGPPMASP